MIEITLALIALYGGLALFEYVGDRWAYNVPIGRAVVDAMRETNELFLYWGIAVAGCWAVAGLGYLLYSIA